jgi:hypothetical protein
VFAYDRFSMAGILASLLIAENTSMQAIGPLDHFCRLPAAVGAYSVLMPEYTLDSESSIEESRGFVCMKCTSITGRDRPLFVKDFAP